MTEWELAEIITNARLMEAWGKSHGPHMCARVPWPRTPKDLRNYGHNPHPEIDLSLAAARAVIKAQGAAT